MYFVGPNSIFAVYYNDKGQGKTIGPRYEYEVEVVHKSLMKVDTNTKISGSTLQIRSQN